MTPNTALVSIGNGFGAWFRDGLIHVVGPHDMARIERERIDGPRYVAAVRRAAVARHAAAEQRAEQRAEAFPVEARVETLHGRRFGIPVGWIAR